MWEDQRAPRWRALVRLWRVVGWALLAAAVVVGLQIDSWWVFGLWALLVAGVIRAFLEVGALKGRLERPARKAESRAAKAERRRRAMARSKE